MVFGSSNLCVTNEFAPTTQPSGITAPLCTEAFLPIQTCLPIITSVITEMCVNKIQGQELLFSAPL